MTFDKLSRLLFFLALVVVGFFTLDPAPPGLGMEAVNDKLEHFAAFAGLAFLARLGFACTPDWLVLEHLSFIGALIEVAQAAPQIYRDCDWHDWVADSVGALAGIVAVRLLRHLFASHPRSA